VFDSDSPNDGHAAGGYHLDSLRPHDMNDYLDHHHLFSHVFAGASTI
jgi:hypothetical protein